MKKEENALDYIPIKKEKLHYKEEENKIVVILEEKGIFDRIAQLFYRAPKIRYLHLDKKGTYILTLIDGKSTIYDIACEFKRVFQEEAEPLYPRLLQFLQILKGYDLIEISKRQIEKD